MLEETEETRVGFAAVEAVSELLQRIRAVHPVDGLYQAPEVQWWWTAPRSTDDVDQLIWFDGQGRPAAAAFLADFSTGESLVYDEVTFCPLLFPGAPVDRVEHVVSRGIAHARSNGIGVLNLEVDATDEVMHAVLTSHGFEVKERNALVEAWMPAENRPAVSELADGYRLTNRAERADQPHHIAVRNPRLSVERLEALPLYRPDLDLVVLDDAGDLGGYGLFWLDPVTNTGVVEPMRTADAHQQRGIARHVLTSGVNALFDAGATRVSICWEPDNPASGDLYRSVGFEPAKQSDLWAGATD